MPIKILIVYAKGVKQKRYFPTLPSRLFGVRCGNKRPLLIHVYTQSKCRTDFLESCSTYLHPHKGRLFVNDKEVTSTNS